MFNVPEKQKKKKLIFFLVLSILVISSFTVLLKISSVFVSPVQSNVLESSQKNFTLNELKKYNGTDPNLPIYLAMDGLVYDVTAGKEYYFEGGPYHDLAGKDSTKELNFAGGGIIKRKYPVIGKLTD